MLGEPGQPAGNVCVIWGGKKLEARGGIEPPMGVLQTPALPLGDRASLHWDVRKTLRCYRV